MYRFLKVVPAEGAAGDSGFSFDLDKSFTFVSRFCFLVDFFTDSDSCFDLSDSVDDFIDLVDDFSDSVDNFIDLADDFIDSADDLGDPVDDFIDSVDDSDSLPDVSSAWVDLERGLVNDSSWSLPDDSCFT